MTRPKQMAESDAITLALASIPIGESQTFPWKTVNALSTYRREKARRLLNNPQANWSARSVNHGLRVTRIK